MWKAETIELVKKGDEKYQHIENPSFEDWIELHINGELICNSITDINDSKHFKYFQNQACTYCGSEACDAGGFLIARKHIGRLVFLPDQDEMEVYEEYSYDNHEGCYYCPPHKWFTDGILVVDGEPLKRLIEMVPGLSLELVNEITEVEKEFMLKWESLVKEQPEGFINKANI